VHQYWQHVGKQAALSGHGSICHCHSKLIGRFGHCIPFLRRRLCSYRRGHPPVAAMRMLCRTEILETGIALWTFGTWDCDVRFGEGF
jgi:hypothetical protein